MLVRGIQGFFIQGVLREPVRFPRRQGWARASRAMLRSIGRLTLPWNTSIGGRHFHEIRTIPIMVDDDMRSNHHHQPICSPNTRTNRRFRCYENRVVYSIGGRTLLNPVGASPKFVQCHIRTNGNLAPLFIAPTWKIASIHSYDRTIERQDFSPIFSAFSSVVRIAGRWLEIEIDNYFASHLSPYQSLALEYSRLTVWKPSAHHRRLRRGRPAPP